MSLDQKAWQAVAARIAASARAAGRDPASIRLLAVSKGQSAAAIRAAHTLGQRAFGENYVQEALQKAAEVDDLSGLEWHMIGPLQSNKTRVAAERFAWVQTVDRLKIAERLAHSRAAHLPPLNVCVQVNISAEAAKRGAVPEEALALARALGALPRLRLRGFMGIAEETDDAERQRRQFRILSELFARARREGMALDTLSMGMSGDLESAIAEGATMVRIGTALFGPREKVSER